MDKVLAYKLSSLRERFRKKAAKLFLQPPFLKVKLICLQAIFGFGKSSVSSFSLDERYKTAAVDLIATLKPKTVVEFGTGLGGIIEALTAQNRIGFEADKGAISAAKFLREPGPNYIQASFLESAVVVRSLRAIGVQSIDVLILTNWIHTVPTDTLLRELASMHAQIPIRYLLLEALNPQFTGCTHRLSIADLPRFGEVLYGAEAGEANSLHIVTMADFESNQLLKLRQAVGSSLPRPSAQA